MQVKEYIYKVEYRSITMRQPIHILAKTFEDASRYAESRKYPENIIKSITKTGAKP